MSPSGRPGPSTRRLFEHSGAILGPLKMRKSFNKRIPCLTKEFHCLTKEFRFVTLTKEFHSNMFKKLLKLRKSFNKRIPCLTKEFRCLTKEFVRAPGKPWGRPRAHCLKLMLLTKRFPSPPKQTIFKQKNSIKK